jgi:hypothetical protein
MLYLAIGVALLYIFLGPKEDPRDSIAGRWGIKTGKLLSGNWGGKDWGEKDKK